MLKSPTRMTTSETTAEIRALSVGSWFDPLVSVAIIVGTFLALYTTGISHVYLTLVIALLTSIYLFCSELTRAKWSLATRPQQPLPDVVERTLTKFFGVLVGISFIFFLVWLFPAYDNATNLSRLREAILPVLAFVIPVSFILIFVTEYILGEKRDGTYQFGLLVRLKLREINWTIFFDGVREWLLRCFFLLINFYGAVWYIEYLRENGLPDWSGDFVTFITRLDLVIFGMIVLAILPGYIFASRLIGTELKKVDRTWFAWAINLCCYPPINAALFGAWVRYVPAAETGIVYQGMPAWAFHTQWDPFLLLAVGMLVILFAVIHLWGEAIVGIRAANISMRGIITTGPFAFTRHPIYVSKCFQWAVLYFPIINAVGIVNPIQSAILFLLVCAIYGGRALGEEHLLATDPNYVKYALYMDEKSMFARIGRWFPIMTFRWRYDYWTKKGMLQQ